MKNLVIAILILLLILLALLVVISIRTHPDRIILPKKASFYIYYITLNRDVTIQGIALESGEWLPHYETFQAGDTLKLWRHDKCLLSERNNLINAVSGAVEYENVAEVWEVKDETGSNPALSGL
jgi:hypothetical protein